MFNKTEVLQIRLSPEEKQYLRDAADRKGVSMTEFLLEAARSHNDPDIQYDCRKRHTWRMPEVGDRGLFCDNPKCKYHTDPLNFLSDITPNMRSSIIAAQENRGPSWCDTFRNAYHVAADYATQHYLEEETRRNHPSTPTQTMSEPYRPTKSPWGKSRSERMKELASL